DDVLPMDRRIGRGRDDQAAIDTIPPREIPDLLVAVSRTYIDFYWSRQVCSCRSRLDTLVQVVRSSIHGRTARVVDDRQRLHPLVVRSGQGCNRGHPFLAQVDVI